ncbi:cytochrome c oxidase polypeptide vib [Verticillium alfalfae VaMs.102]|uniref:Cytochrome c oxidase polypeptide vib n=1 Tax=Verticillium alfalfae (strain VaMs.102 / ATCC MYA-4576 / FGSC 10136) TaxID=526221 RepID=C9SK57_VERA1|nr:cytochrome c oxidase polypeptide vib [Verticillium alfalfae VaMs.102]EEY19075.1 cytochrome c oxidase polypeptide vib [Verticillium alfalfae VaMs.102]
MSDDQELVTKPFNWYEIPPPDAVHDCDTIEKAGSFPVKLDA